MAAIFLFLTHANEEGSDIWLFGLDRAIRSQCGHRKDVLIILEVNWITLNQIYKMLFNATNKSKFFCLVFSSQRPFWPSLANSDTVKSQCASTQTACQIARASSETVFPYQMVKLHILKPSLVWEYPGFSILKKRFRSAIKKFCSEDVTTVNEQYILQ